MSKYKVGDSVRIKLTGEVFIVDDVSFDQGEYVYNKSWFESSLEPIKADQPKPTRQTILDEAARIVTTDREQQYGSVEDNFSNIAEIWQLYIKTKFDVDVPLKGDDTGVMMALLKIIRIAGGNYKADSYVDGCGYLACAAEIAGGGKSCD